MVGGALGIKCLPQDTHVSRRKCISGSNTEVVMQGAYLKNNQVVLSGVPSLVQSKCGRKSGHTSKLKPNN